MVLQSEDNTVSLCIRQTRLNRGDNPGERLIFSVAGEHRFLSFQPHQFVKRAGGAPSSRIKSNRRDAEFVCQTDAVHRVIDILLSRLRIWRNETLMNGERVEIEPVNEREPLQFLQIRIRLRCHLLMQNFNAI